MKYVFELWVRFILTVSSLLIIAERFEPTKWFIYFAMIVLFIWCMIPVINFFKNMNANHDKNEQEEKK